MADRIPIAIAGLVAVVLVVAGATLRQQAPSTPSDVTAYRVDYRVEERAERDPVVRHESVWVRRPYDSRVVTSGAGAPGTGRVTNREFQWELASDGEPRFGFRRPPGPASRDASATALRDAASAGVIDRLGTGTWLGRACTWFAFENPFPQALAPPTPQSRVEACVDPAGIVLRDVWSLDGRVVRIVEARDVEIGRIGDAPFLYGLDPEDDEVSDDAVEELLRSQTVVADDVPTPHVPFGIRAPSGWQTDRRSVVVQGTVGGSRPGQAASAAFVRGGALVVVEQGLRPGEEPTWPSGEGEPVDVGIGNARLLSFPGHVELRITVPGEGFARVLGPGVGIARRFAEALRLRDA